MRKTSRYSKLVHVSVHVNLKKLTAEILQRCCCRSLAVGTIGRNAIKKWRSVRWIAKAGDVFCGVGALRCNAVFDTRGNILGIDGGKCQYNDCKPCEFHFQQPLRASMARPDNAESICRRCISVANCRRGYLKFKIVPPQVSKFSNVRILVHVPKSKDAVPH